MNDLVRSAGIRVHIHSLFVAGMARMTIRRWFLRRREARQLIMTIGNSGEKMVIKARKFGSGMVQAIITARGVSGNRRVWITEPFVPEPPDIGSLN